jgi:hypothetical protein
MRKVFLMLSLVIIATCGCDKLALADQYDDKINGYSDHMKAIQYDFELIAKQAQVEMEKTQKLLDAAIKERDDAKAKEKTVTKKGDKK